MPFTNNGYEVRRFDTLLEQLRSSLENNLGTPISSSPDSVIGILNSVIGNQLAIQENDIQALSNNLDIYKAEGVYLDKLVRYIGISRLSAQPAKGLLKITRNAITPINSSTTFATGDGTRFVCPTIRTAPELCNAIGLSPVTAVQGVVYSININTNNFTKTASATDTLNDIINHFVTDINGKLGYTTSNDNGTLRISVPDTSQNGLIITSIGNFNVVDVTSYNDCESLESRFLQVPANVVNTLITSRPSIVSFNNPFAFVSGRNLETDEELRARYENSFFNGGNTTFDNILGRLLQLPNVVDVVIRENQTINADLVTGLPPKSYECIVVEGNPENIAEAIWVSKPLGIETHGDILSSVIDIKGNSHTVKWSRPDNIYIFVEVTYSKYDEEVFPVNGDTLIREAVLEYGQSLSLDNDVIPERFIGGIYRAVDGVDSISIRIGWSTDVNDTSPNSGYLTSRIPIGEIQLPIFTRGRITLIEV